MSNENYRPESLMEVIIHFSDEKVAFDYLVARRWANGVTCPHCQSEKVKLIETRLIWRCNGCKKQFSVKVGTIFEDSPIKLGKWLAAMWLIANCKNGISSYELGRAIKVTQKSAWHMNHRIRTAMDNDSIEMLSGEVESDESYIGGLAKNMHWDKRATHGELSGGFGKTIVMGIIERGGKGVFEVIERRRGTEMKPIVHKHVEKGSTIYTDNHGAYHGLYKDYTHGVVDHSVAYTFGPIHTNTCEAFWSLLKRSLRGTYVSVEPAHLHRYLGEYGFRYNERKGNDGDRFFKLVSLIVGKRLTYAKLTGRERVQ